MRKLTMFIAAVCVLFLIKLRWPKNKSLYVTQTTMAQEQKSLCSCTELYIVTHWKLNSRQTKLLKTAVSINFIRVGLFAIHLLVSHADIYSLHQSKFYFNALVDCVCYNEDSVKSRFCSIQFTFILAPAEENRSLYRGLRYTEVH